VIPLRSLPALAIVLASLVFAAYLQSTALRDASLYALPSAPPATQT
jgi:hypothetical protein